MKLVLHDTTAGDMPGVSRPYTGRRRSRESLKRVTCRPYAGEVAIEACLLFTLYACEVAEEVLSSVTHGQLQCILRLLL